jgi:hypothetical protein
MPYKEHVEGEDQLLRHLALQELLGLDGIGPPGDEPQATGYPVHMRVHRQGWTAQGEEEDAGGRLGPHPWEVFKPGLGLLQGHLGEEGEVQGAASLQDLCQEGLEALGLDAAQTPHAYGVFQLLLRGGQDISPLGEPSPQAHKGAARVGIAGVLGEDGQD